MSFDKLLGQQSIHARYIRNFMQNFEKLGRDRHTPSTIDARRKLLEDYWQKFQSNNAELYNLADATALSMEDYFVKDEYSSIELCYTEYYATLTDMLMAVQPKKSSEPQSMQNCAAPVAPTPAYVKLPPITLPTFSGSVLDWEPFRDLFTALIHSKAELSNVQKLHYLKCNLKGEAEQILRNVQISDANYAGAWDTLVKRYDNNRLLITTHLNRLLSLPNLSHETSNGLKHLLDGTMEVVRALTNLKRPVEYWDDILIHLTVQKFDDNTRREWETSIGAHTEMPMLSELEDFMISRIQVVEAMNNASPKLQSTKINRNVQSMHVDASKCVYCQKANHPLWACYAFKRQSVGNRRQFVQSAQVCFNCLKTGHRQMECTSNSICRHCDQSHHTLLHISSTPKAANMSPTKNNNTSSTARNTSSQSTSHNSSANGNNSSSSRFTTPPSASSTLFSSSTPSTSGNTSVHTASCNEPYMTANNVHLSSSFVAHPVQTASVLLATANVSAINENGKSIVLRALIDPGSEVTLISESAVQRLKLRRSSSTVTISGVGATNAGRTKGKVLFTLASLVDHQFTIKVTALIIPKLTKLLPSKKVVFSEWSYIRDIPLADPMFATPAQIDILIGADLYVHMLCDGIRRGPPGSPIAIETKLGWILNGPTHAMNNNDTDKQCFHLNVADTDENLNTQLRRFWEVETISAEIPLSDDDNYCEQHFKSTHTRTADGRYTVRLPFRPTCSISDLGVSRHIAVQRMRSLNKRLATDTDLHSQYTTFLVDYVTLHHMVEDYPQITESYYLPHHGVLKPGSSSTKLRVVFNASQKTSSGNSLNDLLCIGPKLQSDLHDLIVRWRTHFVVYTADIEKMYRQILVNASDTQLQRIVWSPRPGMSMQDYRLQTVTYGTSCAPFLAIRTLKQLANDERSNFPSASEVLLNDFYVDDVLSGAEDETQALAVQKELTNLLQAGGFVLKKWSSNRKSLLEAVPESFRECSAPLSLNPDDCVKTLGLFWYPLKDTFQYKVCISERPSPVTKRNMLSDVAKLYDPIGLVAPVIITAKIMIQELWLSGTGWDDQLSADIILKWQEYRDSLRSLENISIDRWLGTLGTQHQYQLHGFSDASSKAFAAAVYLRVENAEGQVQVSLICSKTKVAPIKTISVPRLELCGAELLAQLMEKVEPTLRCTISSMYAWTDSTIVLSWLQKEPNVWKTFVGNRVSHIQQLVPPKHWRHVSTVDNPVDHATRGLTAAELGSCKIWWSGPEWLASPAECWPSPTVTSTDDVELERKATPSIVTCAIATNNDSLLFRFSSLSVLLKVTAWCQRFIANAKTKKPNRDARNLAAFISAAEIRKAEKFWFRCEQSNFDVEIKALQTGGPVLQTSRLSSLNPFLDKDGIIRVGGRLEHANISFDAKHPIVLPNSSRLAALFIDHAHRDLKHGSAQATMSYARQRIWIINGRNLVRRYIHKCVTCCKYRARSRQQIMGNLPPARIEQSRPFQHVGLDYAGPILYRPCSGRGQRRFKAYIALFICFVTKAVIIELVGDNSTETCIAALRRFIARVGVPSQIYSDCGTNFVGANNRLQEEEIKYTRDQRVKIAQYAATKGTTWNFNPPASPHFGGIWEAGVKAAKQALKKTVGDSALTVEELRTLLMEIEACLNSRPLYAMSSDAADLNALTPAHLIGREPLGALPEPSYLQTKPSALSRWQVVQQMSQSFWDRWHKDYLHQLNQRPKWKRTQPSIQVGDLVVVMDDRLSSTRWPLARVIEVHPGVDGHVRVATIRTASSTFKRPIVKLCRLPMEPPTENEA